MVMAFMVPVYLSFHCQCDPIADYMREGNIAVKVMLSHFILLSNIAVEAMLSHLIFYGPIMDHVCCLLDLEKSET